MKASLKLTLEAVAFVALAVGAKLALHYYNVDLLEQNSLLTSLIAGATFVFGLILAGTIDNYKESDRMPSDMVAALESILAEAKATRHKTPGYDPLPALRQLAQVTSTFRDAVYSGDYEGHRQAIAGLSPLFAEMEKNGGLPQYMSRLRSDQSVLMRTCLRVSHIQRIDFLPSLHWLLTALVALVVSILMFTAIEPLYLAEILIAFVVFMYAYMLRLQRRLERPFGHHGDSRDDVCLSLLLEFEERIAQEIHVLQPPATASPAAQPTL